MYLGSASLKRFHDDGRPDEDRPLLDWACEHAAWKVEEALQGVVANLPNRVAAGLTRVLAFPLGSRYAPPSDRLGTRVAQSLLDGGETRVRLTPDVYIPASQEQGLGELEATLEKVVRAQPIRRQVKAAARAGTLDGGSEEAQIAEAIAKGLITETDSDLLAEAAAARWETIQVDAFEPESYHSLRG